jgi:hypothetical protein
MSDVARPVLPIPERQHVGLTTYDAKDPDTSYPPIEPLRPPAGAPNVLVIMLDDAGFGSSSAFGGPCNTPTFERLAGEGLRFNRFHTTALCSPTRQALLTGRNHHAVGMGGITEIATSAPGYDSIRPDTAAPLAETLKLNGYSTAQLGKCHTIREETLSRQKKLGMVPPGALQRVPDATPVPRADRDDPAELRRGVDDVGQGGPTAGDPAPAGSPTLKRIGLGWTGRSIRSRTP